MTSLEGSPFSPGGPGSPFTPGSPGSPFSPGEPKKKRQGIFTFQAPLKDEILLL